MKIKLKNIACKKCRCKKNIIALNKNKETPLSPPESACYKESPLPEPPEPDYYYETFWGIKKTPPK